MDPQATLFEILVRLAAGDDAERVEELLEALRSWIVRGGFLPTVERRAERLFFIPVAGGAA